MEIQDVAGANKVLATASRLSKGRLVYDVRLAAEKSGTLRTEDGLDLQVAVTLRGVRGAIDTLFVPGGALSAVDDSIHLARDVSRLAQRARRIVGIGAGTFLLAEAGLLENRRVVTSSEKEMSRRSKSSEIETGRTFQHDGPVWTGAGTSAAMDVALALVEEDRGSDLSLAVADALSLNLRLSSGRSPVGKTRASQIAHKERIVELMAWIRKNLTKDLSVEALAKRTKMSKRNFARVFAAQAGNTPAALIRWLRVDEARSALERTKKSVPKIAESCGFDSVETMTEEFQSLLGTTPQDVRKQAKK